jgi:cytochrome c5
MIKNLTFVIIMLFSFSIFADDVAERIKPVGSLKLIPATKDAIPTPKKTKESVKATATQVTKKEPEKSTSPDNTPEIKKEAKPAVSAKSGKQIHDTICFACHVAAAEAMKAPKTHSDEWDKRMKVGMDALVQTVIKGKGAMPPNAGNPALTPDEIKSAIEFMASKK